VLARLSQVRTLLPFPLLGIDTDSSFTAFPLPTDGSDGSRPRSIAAGPDGNLWFTEELAGEIGRITTS
jgi:virginiamycin B lyase